MFLLPENYLEAKKIPKMGRGIFAVKDIPAGTIIGDYLGVIVPEKDEDKYDNKGHFYLMYYHDRASIYPDAKKPGVHTINHSCSPNVWMYTYKGHTLYFAIRRIFKGEELTVSYLLSEQDKDCNPCNHICLCASTACTGTMHMSKAKYDKWYAITKKEEKSTKRQRVSFGKILPHLSSYPKEILDNAFYTLFGYAKTKPEIITSSKLPSIEKMREKIRTTGRTLQFPKLNLHVLGVMDGVLVSRSIH